MNYGVALPYTSARNVARYSQLVEENGWDGCFLGDAIWCEDPMICLAAAAMSTSRIRLGTMVTPVPLRRPWKLASESLALDRLSDGRLTLGLGAGAVWMGWNAFPDEISEARARAEILDETIDILTLFEKRKQFDYEGKHYHLQLTQLDERHYPPKSVQQPRVPLWCVGIWPHKKTLRRTLKCDGVILESRDSENKYREVTPQDIQEVKAFIEANRTSSTPFDIVLNGETINLDDTQLREKLFPLQEAGATWWIEGLWEQPEEHVVERIRRGPPNFS